MWRSANGATSCPTGKLSRRGILFGTAESAALPALYAATNPDARGGKFYGPTGFQHLGGGPGEQALYSRLTSTEDARRIWAAATPFLRSCVSIRSASSSPKP